MPTSGNGEYLYDVFDDPYTEDEGTPVKPRWEIERVAALIRKIDADVVVITEVENEGVLRAMVHEMLPCEGYGHVAVMPTNSRRGGNLGLISRRPIVSLTSHRFVDLSAEADPAARRFARDLLRVRLRVTKDRVLDLYLAHFKSQRNRPGDARSRRWRLAEAKETRRIIDGYRRRVEWDWTLLLGDLNDTPESPVLAAIRSPRSGEPEPLIDLHAHLPAEDRVTYLSRKHHDTLDYILASPALALRVIPDSARVSDAPALLSGSDHAPVVATFELGDGSH